MYRLPINEELSMKLLTEKTVMLLLLLGGERINSLTAFSVETIQFSTTECTFIPRKRLTQQTFVLMKASWRRLEDVFHLHFQEYHQVKLFLLTHLRDVFNTFLRCTTKTVIYRKICLGHTSEKFMVTVQNLQEWQKFLKF